MKRRIVSCITVLIFIITIFGWSHKQEMTEETAALEGIFQKGMASVSQLEFETDFQGEQEYEVNKLEHSEIEYISDEAYERMKKSYDEIDFSCTFESGEKESYQFYLEKFSLLLAEKVKFTLSEAEKKAGMAEAEEFYLSEYGELQTHSTAPFEPEDYLYYFFDMSGDGIPELCITNKDYGSSFVYIFQYQKETDEIILWHELSNGYYHVLGTGKAGYSHDGLASGSYHSFYQLDERGNLSCEVRFLLYCERKTGEEVVLYMVGIPESFGEEKKAGIEDDSIGTPYKISNMRGTYYRVSEEQFEALTGECFATQQLAREKLKQFTYTYRELFLLK